jgi:hypothetical protein
MTTPAELLQAEQRRDGARPLVTWYDDATGERIELSVTTAANWSAKTANLLADEHGLGPGDTVALTPTSHWLCVVVLLGAWTAGVAVDVTGAAGDVSLPDDPGAFMRAVLPQPDALLAAPADASDVALVTTTQSWSLAQLVATAGNAPVHCRVLSTLPLDTIEGVRAAVVVPLLAGGSAVLVTNPDVDGLSRRASAERVSHTAGPLDLPGIPHLVSGTPPGQ